LAGFDFADEHCDRAVFAEVNAGRDILRAGAAKATPAPGPLRKPRGAGRDQETGAEDLNKGAPFQAEVVADLLDQFIVIRFGRRHWLWRVHRVITGQWFFECGSRPPVSLWRSLGNCSSGTNAFACAIAL